MLLDILELLCVFFHWLQVYKQASKLFPPLLDMLHDQVDKVRLLVYALLGKRQSLLLIETTIVCLFRETW